MIDNVTRLARYKRVGLGNRQPILLKPVQLEAIALHLEQAAREIRAITAPGSQKLAWVSDTQHVETIVESTAKLLRDIQRCSSNSDQLLCDFSQSRIGRPRRTRRRKP